MLRPLFFIDQVTQWIWFFSSMGDRKFRKDKNWTPPDLPTRESEQKTNKTVTGEIKIGKKTIQKFYQFKRITLSCSQKLRLF